MTDKTNEQLQKEAAIRAEFRALPSFFEVSPETFEKLKGLEKVREGREQQLQADFDAEFAALRAKFDERRDREFEEDATPINNLIDEVAVAMGRPGADIMLSELVDNSGNGQNVMGAALRSEADALAEKYRDKCDCPQCRARAMAASGGIGSLLGALETVLNLKPAVPAGEAPASEGETKH